MPEEPEAESAYEDAAEPSVDGWRIIAESTGGEDLHDCIILEVAPTHYKFLDRHFKSLAESTIFPPIFEDVELNNQKFTVSVRTNLADDPKFAFGSWSSPTQGASGGGDWTAQSGIGPIAAKAASADAS
ncbi:MAG TPA: hypothetical protein VJM12_08665 [Pyrinomonadaceae bacterium]|nr:hypothetical protein [Pyrinomonadaceae bacterium]